MADDLDLEIEIARARAKAKREKAAASGVTVDGLPAFSETSVETPQGAQRMVNGRPVLSVDELKQRLAGQDAAGKLEAYKALLAGIQGPANFLTDRVAGLKAAAQALPKWMEGDGRDLGDIYAKGRDDARKVVDESVQAYPMAPLVGSVVTAPFSPVAGSSVGRVLSTGYQGGLGSFGASRGGDQLGDTLKGVGLGLGVGGGFELAGKGARFLAGRAGQQGDLAEDVIRDQALKATESSAAKVTQRASASSAEIGRRYDLAQAVLARPSATEAEKAWAQSQIDLPEVQAWLINRQTNAVSGLGSGAREFAELSEAASQAKAGVADEAAALGASKIENAGQPLWDSTKRQLFRATLGAAGAGIGYGLGAASDAVGLTDLLGMPQGSGRFGGGLLGAGMGAAATGTVNAFRNNMGNPQTQLLFNRGTQSLLSKGADLASKLGSTATQVGAESAAYTGRPPQGAQLLDLLSLSRGQQFDPTGNRSGSPTSATLRSPPPLQTPTPSDTSAPDAGFEDLKKRLGIDGREKLSEQHYLGQ